MRLVKSPILLLILCGALVHWGCGGGDDDDDSPGDDSSADDNSGDDSSADDSSGDDGGDTGVNPDGEDHTYVVDSVAVPENATDAENLGLDIDGDSMPDNGLGTLIATLISVANLDLQTAITEQVDQGGIILLANLKATDLAEATGVGLYVYLGADANPAPCENAEDTVCRHHLDGTGTFGIAADSPENALIVGENAGGAFTGGPGEVTIELALADGADPLSLTLVNAKAEATVAADGLSSGKLGGAVTQDEINNNILPAVADIVAGIVAADPTCTLGPPDCCEDGTAKTVLGFLDDDGDCVVSVEELQSNSLLSTLLTPDVDLFDAAGNPGTDGTDDSLSLGIGFTAVGGGFTPP